MPTLKDLQDFRWTIIERPDLTHAVTAQLADVIPKPYEMWVVRLLDGACHWRIELVVQYKNRGREYQVAVRRNPKDWDNPQVVEWAIDCIKNRVVRSMAKDV